MHRYMLSEQSGRQWPGQERGRDECVRVHRYPSSKPLEKVWPGQVGEEAPARDGGAEHVPRLVVGAAVQGQHGLD
jgi:hypothetical protein